MKKAYKSVLGAAVLGSLLVLAGCVVTSVHPYFTSRDVVSDPALIGRWAEADAQSPETKHWRFEAGKGNAYKLFVQEGDERTEYVAHLFQLKGRRFLDAMPARQESDFIPPHYLLHVTRLEGEVLEMSLMDYDWLKQWVKAKPKSVEHLWIEEGDGKARLVLTADTAELQAFVLRHLANTNAFKPALSLRQR